ncbi:hypothetical protein [Streptomyces sp. NPDC020298]|uniref:hypothetical protein n=1 Tax=unclassified Streptomyces TaxID=2593676 RepID=UPI0033EC6B25
MSTGGEELRPRIAAIDTVMDGLVRSGPEQDREHLEWPAERRSTGDLLRELGQVGAHGALAVFWHGAPSRFLEPLFTAWKLGCGDGRSFG